jgi:hypothetical protein
MSRFRKNKMRIDDSRGEEKIRGGELRSFLFNPKAQPSLIIARLLTRFKR